MRAWSLHLSCWVLGEREMGIERVRDGLMVDWVNWIDREGGMGLG